MNKYVIKSNHKINGTVTNSIIHAGRYDNPNECILEIRKRTTNVTDHVMGLVSNSDYFISISDDLLSNMKATIKWKINKDFVHEIVYEICEDT